MGVTSAVLRSLENKGHYGRYWTTGEGDPKCVGADLDGGKEERIYM
jgi:hypothetical protein